MAYSVQSTGGCSHPSIFMDNSFGRKFVNLIFNNGQIVFLLFVFVLIASTISFYVFRPQGFPEFNINIAIVTAKYPGATALQVEDQVVKPIERAISEIKTVDEYSATANDSFAVLTVSFDENANMTDAMRELDGKLAKVKMPDGVDQPETQKINPTGPTAIVAMTLNNDVGKMSDWELYNKAKIVKTELEGVEGVKEVKVMNPLTPQITITYNQSKLDQLGLQRSQIEGILKLAQLEIPIGSFYDTQQDKTALGIKKELNSITQLEEIVVSPPNIRLKDIAVVTTELNNNNQYNRVGYRTKDVDKIADAGDFNMSRAIIFSIMANEGEDLLGLGKRLDEKYTELENRSDLAPDLKLVKAYDLATYTGDQLKEIEKSIVGGPIDALGPWGVIGYLFGGITLVVLFLLIFVNWRVALLAGLSIPLAIGMTTAYLKLTGVSINTIVLFSMILVVGLVVDPTIVFLEAMQRYREQGYSGREAAVKTLNSVGVGVFLSAIANFMVFVPFGVVSGFFGQIIQYIPKTVIPAIVASFIVPILFFIPVASRWLKAHKQNGNTDNLELVGVWPLSRALERGIKGLLGKGNAILRVFIIFMALVAPVAIGLIFIGGEKIRIVQFANPKDSDRVLINGSVSERWAFDKAVGMIDSTQKYLAKQPEVRKFAVFSQSGNSFTLFIELFPMVERQREELRNAKDFVADFNEQFVGLSDATIEASSRNVGPPKDNYQVSIQLFDQDLSKLKTAADNVGKFLSEQDGVVKVENSLNVDGNKNSGIGLVLDNTNLLNLNPFTLITAIKNQLDETDVVNMNFDGESYKVVTKTDRKVTSLDDVKNLPVKVSAPSSAGSLGIMTGRVAVAPTVSNFISGVGEQVSQSIARLDGKRYVEIRAKVDEDTVDPLKVQSALTNYLTKDKLTSLGLSDKSATKTKGIAGSVATSFTQLFLALIIALFLIYLILVGFFRSLLSPMIILLAVPLGFIGAFPAVAIATGQLGFMELLGVVAMAGIVVNVTILIIDFANQMRAKGMSAQEAISTSIAVRFKPILLTKMTIFAGLMPLVLFSTFWRGLAIVIVFGIIVSGFLSFLTTPILYVWFDAVGKWFRKSNQSEQFNQSNQFIQSDQSNQLGQSDQFSREVQASAGLWGQKPVDEVVWQIAPDQGIDE